MLSLSFDKEANVLGQPIGKIDNCYFFISSLRNVVQSNTIKLWEGQRSLDQERVKEISYCFLKQYEKTKTINLRGSILLCKKNDLLFSDNFYLIDGQHRYHSLMNLLVNNKIPDMNIRIDVLVVQDEKEIRNEFININKSVPVPNHYLSPNDIVTSCCNLLTKKFPKAFSQGNCKRPSINIDKFKDVFIDKANFFTTLELKNGDDLYHAVIKLNNYYYRLGSQKLQDLLARNNKNERRIIANCFDKCSKGEYLLLGLFKDTNWTIDLINENLR